MLSQSAVLVDKPTFLRRLKAGTRRSSRVRRWHAATRDVEQNYPPSLERLICSFRAVPDPLLRYKQLLFLAKKLPPFPADQRLDENKVPGCTSQVWISVSVRDGIVYVSADSDSQLTKGLAALLVLGLSEGSVQQILDLRADFVTEFGFNQSLTPSRTNGFLNMVQLVKEKVRTNCEL